MWSGRSRTTSGKHPKPLVEMPEHLDEPLAVISLDEGACPVIVVTRLDGRKMALNVDRIERVERNETTSDTNLYFIGGARLTVTDDADEVLDRIVEAKARVIARAFTMSGESGPPPLGRRPEQEHTPASLRVLPPEGE